MDNRQLPASNRAVNVDLTGALIADEEPTPGTREIYLPKHTEVISHIALDIGGSLAKMVYFTRTNGRKEDIKKSILQSSPSNTLSSQQPPSPNGHSIKPNGFLGPKSISDEPTSPSSSHTKPHKFSDRLSRRRSSVATVPGGRLNFVIFETDQIDDCIDFISSLIATSSASHHVSIDQMKKSVKIMATGGGAHLYYEKLVRALNVEVRREEEMDCLITGLTFLTEIPDEVFWYSDDLVDAVSHRPPRPPSLGSKEDFFNLAKESMSSRPQKDTKTSLAPDDLPRPSPNPPHFSLIFESHPKPQYPCMLVNIGSGVSIIKVDDEGHFERISGTSLGGGTLWGLLSLLTGASTFDEMLALSEQGDNSTVDMLVGDIYGSDYTKIGLKSSTIASSFGKVFRKGKNTEKKTWRPEDISRSLLYAVSNNIGQIAYMNAEKHNLDRIYFGGCFIRGHAATMSTLSYAIRFWSKGTKTALFLRHEGFLGAVGAWLKNIVPAEEASTPPLKS